MADVISKGDYLRPLNPSMLDATQRAKYKQQLQAQVAVDANSMVGDRKAADLLSDAVAFDAGAWLPKSRPKTFEERRAARDASASTAGDSLPSILGAPVETAAHAVAGIGNTLDNAGQFAADLFTPLGEIKSRQKAKASPQAFPSNGEIIAQYGQRPEQGQGQNLSNIFDIGPAATASAPPQIPAPATVDLSAPRDWLAKAAPKATPEIGDDADWKYALQGAAEGMLNVKPGDSSGDTILKVGTGVLKGNLQVDETNRKIRQVNAQAEQDYAKLMANGTLDLAKMDAENKNALLNVAYKNAVIKHETAIDALAKAQPKFLGMNNGLAMYQIIGDGGRVQMKTFDTGVLRSQAMYKAMGKHGTGDGMLADAMAADAAPADDPFAYSGMIAAQILNSGVAPTVFGKDYEKIDTEARQAAMLVPGTEAQKNEAYKKQVIGNLAGMLMNDRTGQVTNTAAQFSPFARALQYKREQIQRQSQPDFQQVPADFNPNQ